MRKPVRFVVACVAIAATSCLTVSVPATADTTTATAAPVPSVEAGDSLELVPTPSATPKVKTATKGTAPKRTTKAGLESPDKAKPKPPADPHADEALHEASEALTAAETELSRAQETLTAAREDLEVARVADLQAQAELEAAELAHERAQRELVENRLRLEERRSDLGQLARAAYQSNGPLGELALVLESQTPKQMTDRVAFVQSIATAGNAVVADLEEARADLENAKARLAAARQFQRERRAAAAQALVDITAKEQAASLAEQQVGMVVTLRKLALAAALEAKKLDQSRYQVMRVQSGRLGSRITSLGAALDAGKKPPKGTGTFVLPSTGAQTSPFGPRLHPILNYVKIHTGMDLGVGDGYAYAADDGVVIITEGNVAYGNMTVIYHGKRGGLGVTTMYAHQAAFAVKPGDRVRKGQPIGLIGSTGYSTGPHLHFEVMLEGRQVDPAPFLEGAKLPTSRG